MGAQNKTQTGYLTKTGGATIDGCRFLAAAALGTCTCVLGSFDSVICAMKARGGFYNQRWLIAKPPQINARRCCFDMARV